MADAVPALCDPWPNSSRGVRPPLTGTNDLGSVSLTATTVGHNGVSATVAFSVANAEALFNSNNAAFNDLAGPDTGDFDWGLPFFLGRPTFIAIEGQSTSGGTGPYWAY